MKFNIYFDIAAVCICMVLLLAYYLKRKLSTLLSKLFEALIWTSGLASATDIIAATLDGSSNLMTLKWLVNMAHFLFHNATPFLTILYFTSIVEPMAKISARKNIVILLPYAFETLLIAFNPLLRWLFYFDESGAYHRGNAMWICYAVYIYYLIYLAWFVIKHSEAFSNLIRAVILLFSILYVIPILIQLFLPGQLIECFAATIFVAVIYVIYQTNDNSTDSVTKLMSWQAFENDCRSYISSGLNYSVLVIKLCDIKFLTDMFGAQFSARVMTAFANFISKFVRVGNSYSFGNGIFALCFMNESIEPKQVMDSLTERMQKTWGFDKIKTKLSYAMSLVSYPLHASDYSSYVELIDTIFSGSDVRGIIYADNVVVKDRRRKLNIENSLNSENVRRDIEIFYQPIFSSKEKRFSSFEALVRLKDPILGYIMPDEFISIAEKSGAMVNIGGYIFESVCKFISHNNLDELGIRYVAVNLSVVQCIQTDLVTEIVSLMQKYNVNPSMICFEISETAASEPPDIMLKNINELHSLGVSFALDNYGTGNLSIQQLMLMPMRYIKFDSSFIRSADKTERGRVLLQSSVHMSKSINLGIIAQGVEDEAMATSVKELGFDYYQGYYIAPVCTATEAFHKVKVLNNELVKSAKKK